MRTTLLALFPFMINFTQTHLVLRFACLLPFHSWIKMLNFIDLGALKYIVILELGGKQ
jgi:hypothetical protein